MKKYLIITGIILLTILTGIFYIRMTTKTTVYSGLSNRAKEYLKDKRGPNDRQWQNTKLEKKGDGSNKSAIKTVDDHNCFSVTIPIPSSEIRREADCQYRIFLTDPVGFSIVFRRSIAANTIDDVADVSMRRLYKDQYVEKISNINGREFYIFRKKADSYEKSAFLLKNNQLYVFSLVVQTNENLDKKFDEMLQSIKIYNE